MSPEHSPVACVDASRRSLMGRRMASKGSHSQESLSGTRGKKAKKKGVLMKNV